MVVGTLRVPSSLQRRAERCCYLPLTTHHSPLTLELPMVGRVFLGRYQVINLLGQGGMGKVFLARQLDLDRQGEVKVIPYHIPADPKFRDRFKRETLLLANFHHPSAVPPFDASLNYTQG